MREIIEPTLAGMRARGTPFKGVLFAGLMITADGPKLIEYNVRFGDPECAGADAAPEERSRAALLAACDGVLEKLRPALVGRGGADRRDGGDRAIPGAVEKGSEIRGIDRGRGAGGRARLPCRHEAGWRADLVANGGRVLNVTATGKTITEAQRRAYEAVDADRLAGGLLPPRHRLARGASASGR